MARYPDNYFDLAIFDPPYGIGASKQSQSSSKIKGRKNSIVKRSTLNSKNWDNEIPSQEYFNELFRVSKNQIIWGGNYFPLPLINSWIVWNKLQVLETRSDGEMAWTSFKRPLKIVPLLQDGFKRGQNVGYNQPVIYNEPFSGKQTIHPTQKPVALYKWLLDKYAQQGDKILDTHLGSGSIAIACHDYGFDLTACELDKEYFDKAMQRITNHTNQLKLFI
jgi:site-specific DNA-methyltransferase (adenine-specific)